MKTQNKLLLSVALGLGGFFLLKNFSKSSADLATNSNVENIVESKSSSAPQTQATLPPTAGLEKVEELGQNQFLGKMLEEFNAPDAQTYRQEVEADPHSTPSSLLDFARDLTPHVERGLTVKSYAPTVMDFLEKCALGTDIPTAAKASCLVNAGRLKQAHPEILNDRFKTLKENVSAHTLKIAKGIGLKE